MIHDCRYWLPFLCIWLLVVCPSGIVDFLQLPEVFFSSSLFRALEPQEAFLPGVFAVVLSAVEFVSSCNNSIIFLAVLSSSNAVSNSCCKCWQQIHLKPLITIVKSEILRAFVSLLLTTTAILIWYDAYNHTSVGNKSSCFYLHFSDAPNSIEPTSIHKMDNFNLTRYCSCHRVLVEHRSETMYWPHLWASDVHNTQK